MPTRASRTTTLIGRSVAAAAITAITWGALTGCAATAPTMPATAAIPTGQHGAANLDEGYLQIGSGPRTVDLYVDAMCPYCKAFEELSGPQLFTDAREGHTTVRLHPLAILDRLSQGSAYSTRAASYLTAVAVAEPDKLQSFVEALYAHQPQENTSGLTNRELAQLAADAGVSAELAPASYDEWVQQHTANALQGPLRTTDQLQAIKHVPTVIVRGDVFLGNSTDTDAFHEFYLAH